MKGSRIITVITTTLIIAIVVVLGYLVYAMLEGTLETSNQNIENVENLIDTTNMLTADGTTNSEQEENKTIIDPIITTTDDETQATESIVANYYYSQLSDNAKIIYDGLKKNKSNLVSGDYTIDYGTKFNTLLNSEGGEEELSEDFQSAWNAFSYDNADLFYIDATKITLSTEYFSLGGIKTYKVSIGPGDNENYFLDSFTSQEEVENAKAYLEDIKKQMVEQTASDDTYTQIAKVHNWLIYFINYESDETSKDQYTIYGALKNGKAVCEGYARAFKYLLDAIGVPCVLVSGTAKNSQGQTESHAWNYVQIDNKWYAVDVTWDDPVVTGGGEQTSEMKHKYFLKGSTEFFTNHKEDGTLSEGSMSFTFPTLSKEDYNV